MLESQIKRCADSLLKLAHLVLAERRKFVPQMKLTEATVSLRDDHASCAVLEGGKACLADATEP